MALANQIARVVLAFNECANRGNDAWEEKHGELLDSIESNLLPSGSGFDSGTKIEREKCRSDLLVFRTSFHHMNGDGFYDGWTEHTVRVKPDLAVGLSISVSGRDKNEIKDYIAEVFDDILSGPEHHGPQSR